MSDIYVLFAVDVNSLRLTVFSCDRRRCETAVVRWERLFADLEAQFDAAEDAEFAGEVADRSRREIALVTLADRLRSAGADVQLGLGADEAARGRVAGCGPDWVLLTDGTVEVLVPLAAVRWVRGLSGVAETSDSVVLARLGLGYALRGLVRDRAETTVVLTTGERLTGTIDRVGADFVDLAEHPLGEPRRAAAVQANRTLPFSSLAALRRQ
jgi:hypothetical protein